MLADGSTVRVCLLQYILVEIGADLSLGLNLFVVGYALLGGVNIYVLATFESAATETDLAAGDTLKEVALPEGTRVVMIKRDGELIVPDGSVKLKVGDKLLMIMGNQFDESE